MTKDRKGIILLILIFILAVSALIVFVFLSRVPANPQGLTGNTGGNLNNGGLFCEADGKVYFSNAYDNGCLYRMNSDETELEKLNEVNVSSINAGGKYLYYYIDTSGNNSGEGFGYVMRTYGIFRCKTNGENPVCLKRESALTVNLVGNYIYYQQYSTKTDTTLRKQKIDKTGDVEIADYSVNPASSNDGLIYFNGTVKDHYLYTLDTRTDTISLLWPENMWNPVYADGYIYYMDIEHNYRLCRYSPSEDAAQVLTDDRVDLFNVYGGMVYYQKNSETSPALIRMNADGSGKEIIAEGVYEQINITSRYVYFNQFGADSPIYHTPTNGPVNVTTFDAAREAAEARQ